MIAPIGLTPAVRKRRVTVGEIAEIANVTSSAVSNWRRRSKARFPIPVEETPAGALFNLGDIVDWLERNDKQVILPVTTPAENTLWTLSDALRGELRPDQYPELLLPLFYARRFTADRPEHQQAWNKIIDCPDNEVKPRYQQLLGDAAGSDTELRRALVPTPILERVSDQALRRVAEALAETDPGNTDWEALATHALNEAEERIGARGGEYGTSPVLVELMVRLLEPIIGTVFDPACGTGMFLAEAWTRRGSDSTTVVGQEVNEQAWRLAFLNLALHRAKFRVELGDSLLADRIGDHAADRVAIDPPLRLPLRDAEHLERDPRFPFGLAKTADLAWTQQALAHLSDEGQGVQVLALTTLSSGGREAAIRRKLLDANVIDAVIELPVGLQPNARVPIALMILNAARAERDDHILFVDASQLGIAQRGGLRIISEDDFERLTASLAAFRNEVAVDETGFAAVVPLSSLSSVDLNPRRYINYIPETHSGDDKAVRETFRSLRDAFLRQRPDLTTIAKALLRSIAEQPEPEFTSVPLGDLLLERPRNGVARNDGDTTDEYPFVETATVTHGASILTNTPAAITSHAETDRLTQDGDLLLATRGIERTDRAHCVTVRFATPAVYAHGLSRLRINPEEAHADYVRLYLTSLQGHAALMAVASGTVISNLSARALAEVLIRLPDRSVQESVADAMRVIELQRMEYETALDQISALHDTIGEGFVSGFLTPSNLEAEMRQQTET